MNNSPTIITIFGITGDLAAKKIIPSLWQMYISGSFNTNIIFVGFGRRELSQNQFHELIKNALVANSKISDEIKLESFLGLFSYQIGTFESVESFENLSKLFLNIWKLQVGEINKLFCLAVPPSSYESILENLKLAGLNQETQKSWSRVMLEKPFGVDGKSAEHLETALIKSFNESQIYRIDHYLFKDVLDEISAFKISHKCDESKIQPIDQIEIRVLETIGVEDRGNFFDSIGALRDIGQNHILNMLSTITSDSSNLNSVEDVRSKRAKVIDSLENWTDELILNNTKRSQYKGYRGIDKVNPESETETYFKISTKFSSKNPKWEGVKVVLESGKKMPESIKEIVFKLKDGSEEIFKIQSNDEYSKMFQAAMKGDQTRFVSKEEIIKAWGFIDPIIKSWKLGNVEIDRYQNV